MTCSVKNMIWEIFQNSQENTWARVFFKTVTLAQVFSCELREISKTTFSYRTPPEAASEYHWQIFIKPFKVSRSQYNHIYFLYKQSFFFFFSENKTKRKIVLQGFHMSFKWDKTPIILECLSHLENQELYLLQRENALYYLRHFRPTSPPLTIFYCAFTEL